MKYSVMYNRFVMEILAYVNTRNDRGADLRVVSMMPPLQGEQDYMAILEERSEETLSDPDYLDEIKADDRPF